MQTKKTIAILIVIVFIGTLLRFYNIGSVSFVADEFLDMNSSYAYAKTGLWQNWDFNRGIVNVENEFAPRDERAWIYKWQVAQVFKFMPPTEAVARSVSALWGILTIILIFFIGKNLTKRTEIGLLSAFFFAVSISGIIFDRRLRMYAMFFPIFLLFSWLTYKLLESDYLGKYTFIKNVKNNLGINVLFVIPVIAIGLLSFHIHQLTGNILMIIMIYFIIQHILEARTVKNYINKYLVFLGLIVLGMFGAKFIIPDLFATFFRELVFFTNHQNYILITLRDYSHPIIAIMLVVLGAYYLIRDKHTSKAGIWLTVSYLVPLVMAIFLWRRNVGEQYIFFIQSFAIILLSSGVYFSAKFIQENSLKFKSEAFFVIIVLAILVVPQYGYFFEENNTYHQTSKSDSPNYRSVFTYFKKNKGESDVLISRNFRNYYWSGEKVTTFDFGGEVSNDKLTLDDIKLITNENNSGWVIYSDNDKDYISNDAEEYIVKNFAKINAIAVRGNISVYRWGN